MAEDEKPLNRRSFFRDGMWEFLRPLSKPIERKIAPLERALESFGVLESQSSFTPPPQTSPKVSLPVLRPPGALPEEQFLETCSKCGHCVSVCPAAAIQIDEFGVRGKGAPFIDAEMM